jgi:hypothetical protein
MISGRGEFESRKGQRKMRKLRAGLSICITVFATSAVAQTVTGSGTSGYVPVFTVGTPTSTVGNSTIWSYYGLAGIGSGAGSAATLQVGNEGAGNALFIDSNLGGNTVLAPYAGVSIEWNGAPEGKGVTSFVNNEGGAGVGGENLITQIRAAFFLARLW